MDEQLERAKQLWREMMMMIRHLSVQEQKAKVWYDASKPEKGLAFTEWSHVAQCEDAQGKSYNIEARLSYSEHSRLKTEVYVSVRMFINVNPYERKYVSTDWRVYCGCGWDEEGTDMFRAED